MSCIQKQKAAADKKYKNKNTNPETVEIIVGRESGDQRPSEWIFSSFPRSGLLDKRDWIASTATIALAGHHGWERGKK